MNDNMTYLDYAASAPTQHWGRDCAMDHGFNPNQPYAIQETRLLKGAEESVLEFLGSKHGHVVFGANATMIADYLQHMFDFTEPTIISAYEHDCFANIARLNVINPSMLVAHNYHELEDWLESHKEELAETDEACDCFCIWMWVNNLTGEVFPVDEIGKLVHRYNMQFICDLTAGLHNEIIPPNIDEWCDIAIWSGQKIGAEKGTGGIWFSDKAWKRHCLGDEPPVHFGTPNVAQALAQAKAMEQCQDRLRELLPEVEVEEKYSKPLDHIMFMKWHRLYSHLFDELALIHRNYDDVERLSEHEYDDATESIIPLYLPDINADAFQQFASTRHVYFSVFHSACAGKGDYRVAEAYGLTKEQAEHCIRLSFGYETDEQDIDRFIEVLKEFREMYCSDDGVCEVKKELAGRGIPVGLSKD